MDVPCWATIVVMESTLHTAEVSGDDVYPQRQMCFVHDVVGCPDKIILGQKGELLGQHSIIFSEVA
jgi:hypothetical protein